MALGYNPCEVNKMSLIEGLPKEMAKDKFEEFLKQVRQDFPIGKYPELVISYQEMDNKIVVLGLGEGSECAEQTVQAYQENPELKSRRSKSRLLRAPKTKFLLR